MSMTRKKQDEYAVLHPIRDDAVPIKIDLEKFPELTQVEQANTAMKVLTLANEMQFDKALKILIEEVANVKVETSLEIIDFYCPKGHILWKDDEDEAPWLCRKCGTQEFYPADALHTLRGEDIVRSKSILNNKNNGFVY